MNRKELIAAFHSEHEDDLTKAKATEYVDDIMEWIKVAVRDQGEFKFAGFGRIYIKDKKARPARWGRNPQTGEDIWIEAKPKSKTIKFSVFKKFKEFCKIK